MDIGQFMELSVKLENSLWLGFRYCISVLLLFLIIGGCRRHENRPEGRTRAELHVIQVSLEVIAYSKTQGFSPKDYKELHEYLKDNKFLSDDKTPGLRDNWGTEYRLIWAESDQRRVLEVSSAGADRRFGTRDDLATKVPFQ